MHSSMHFPHCVLFSTFQFFAFTVVHNGCNFASSDPWILGKTALIWSAFIFEYASLLFGCQPTSDWIYLWQSRASVWRVVLPMQPLRLGKDGERWIFIHTSDPVMLFCKHILGKLFVHVQFELTTNLLRTCNQGFHERGQCVDIQEIQPLSWDIDSVQWNVKSPRLLHECEVMFTIMGWQRIAASELNQFKNCLVGEKSTRGWLPRMRPSSR